VHAIHGASEVANVKEVADDNIGAELSKMLGAGVFAADHRPDGEAGAKEVLGYRTTGVPGPRGDEDSGFVVGHVKTPVILRFFTSCFIL